MLTLFLHCRQLNPMYEGHLQHDAQEVLQCILGYIQEACDIIRKEQDLEKKGDDVRGVKTENIDAETESKPSTDEDGQVSVKRKSDTEVGNAKKKPKSAKSKKSDSPDENTCGNALVTRSKRKSSNGVTAGSSNEDKEEKKLNKEEENEEEGKHEKVSKEADGKRKKRAKLGWLRSSGKQPSIFSKFCSVGKISSVTVKGQNKAELENNLKDEPNEKTGQEMSTANCSESNAEKHQGLFQQWYRVPKGCSRLDICCEG